MVSTSPLLVALVAAATLLGGRATASDYRVTVAAADVDRAAQVVTFALPADAGAATAMQPGRGTALALQVDTNGAATFVIPEQKAREALTFTTVRTASAVAQAGVVETKASQGQLHVTVEGKPAFTYRMDRDALPRADIKPEFKRAGYIHPVYTPAGKVVTDDYPSNHVHHHGIWSPWTKTKFQGREPDFWNMGTKTGAEDFVALEHTWNGRVHGGFEARLRMVDLSAPTPITALHETWRVTAYNVALPVRVFDLVITQTCATGDPVTLPKYHYGGFGFRGADAWNGPGTAALFLTSEGETDRIKGNDTRGRWCYLGGPIDGGVAGTAILGHPENFRAPQPLRLHPNMPYLSFVPQQLGEFAIEPGKPYVARFRFVAADGAPDRAKIDALWNGYALKPSITIEAAP